MDLRPLKIGQNFNKGNGIKSTISSHGVETNRSTTQQRQAQLPYSVIILDADGSEISSNLPATALKRFSLFASETLPSNQVASDCASSEVTLKVPLLSTRTPSADGIRTIITWIMANRTASCGYLAGPEVSGSLSMKVEALAAAEAIGFRPRPFELIQDIINTIKTEPVSGDALRTMWEVLPHTHFLVKMVVNDAVHMQRTGKLSREEQDDIEFVLGEHDDLFQHFRTEEVRQHTSTKTRWSRRQR